MSSESCQMTISLKSEKNNHVLYAKYCKMIISTSRGVSVSPPLWEIGLSLAELQTQLVKVCVLTA